MTTSPITKLHNTIHIDASPDAVWRVLGDLAATNTWTPGIKAAKVEGMHRVCTTADGFEIHEEISEYSPVRRSFSYSQSRVPIPIKNSRGTFVVKADETGALVVWDAEFEAADRSKSVEITTMVEGFYRQTLDSLRARVEGAK